MALISAPLILSGLATSIHFCQGNKHRATVQYVQRKLQVRRKDKTENELRLLHYNTTPYKHKYTCIFMYKRNTSMYNRSTYNAVLVCTYIHVQVP